MPKDVASALVVLSKRPELIANAGKDAEGFYKPIRTILLRHLQLLKDLHEKPLAKPQLKASWREVVQHLPPEDLLPPVEVQDQLKRMLE